TSTRQKRFLPPIPTEPPRPTGACFRWIKSPANQNPVPGWKLEIEPDLNVDAFFLRSPNPATKQQSPLRPSPAARDCHVHIVSVRACRRKVTITQRMRLFSALLPFCLVLSAIEAVQATRPRMSASSLNALPASRIDEIPRMQLLSLLRDEPTL